ncbi:hypothetical protein ERY430_70392 [Erythrobacter sp. EC-HK427]|nr:hypothetical protein ERY430_70392 [Erythrobacter sp. EC-HK427]
MFSARGRSNPVGQTDADFALHRPSLKDADAASPTQPVIDCYYFAGATRKRFVTKRRRL